MKKARLGLRVLRFLQKDPQGFLKGICKGFTYGFWVLGFRIFFKGIHKGSSNGSVRGLCRDLGVWGLGFGFFWFRDV